MKNESHHFYEFDSFRVDSEERVLLQNGRPVPISPKLFETLLTLVQNSGHITEKQELIQRVWPDTFVEENNLSQHISALRKVLSDDRHEPRFIETVPRRGYRFTAPVREGWERNAGVVQNVQTKVSLIVKEETEEVDEGPLEDAERTTIDVRDPSRSASGLLDKSNIGGWLAVTIFLFMLGIALGVFVFTRSATQRKAVAQSEGTSPAVAPASVTITAYNPIIWPRTDSEIGINGFVIEDFEDSELAKGLEIELTDSDQRFGPTSTLPRTFTPARDDPNHEKIFVQGVWDGARVLLNRRTPPPLAYRDFEWGDVTFRVSAGASSFGFSLDDMDLDTELFVNNVSYGNLKRYLPSGAGRNGYLRIDAARSQPIFAVKIANTATSNTADALIIDHVAFNPSNDR